MTGNEGLSRSEGDPLHIEVAENSVKAYDYAYDLLKDDTSPEAALILQVLTEYAAHRLRPIPGTEKEKILSQAAHLLPEEVEANTVRPLSELKEQSREPEEE